MNFAENIQRDVLPDARFLNERQRSDRLVLSLEGGHVAAHHEAKFAGLRRCGGFCSIFSRCGFLCCGLHSSGGFHSRAFALLHALHIYAVIDDLDLFRVQSDLLPVLTDSSGDRDIAVNQLVVLVVLAFVQGLHVVVPGCKLAQVHHVRNRILLSECASDDVPVDIGVDNVDRIKIDKLFDPAYSAGILGCDQRFFGQVFDRVPEAASLRRYARVGVSGHVVLDSHPVAKVVDRPLGLGQYDIAHIFAVLVRVFEQVDRCLSGAVIMVISAY